MTYQEYKAKTFAEQPEVKAEYDRLAQIVFFRIQYTKYFKNNYRYHN